MADPLGGIFREPFPEQVAAFRLRLGDLVPTSRWDDIRKSAHDRAFVVAGATKADLLADLAQAVDAAISEGESLEQFRARFRDIVETRGWHGWTGEGTRRGEAWRTRIIYQTNMATSYAAGRRAQLLQGNYRFWVYRHSGAENPRLTHLSWNGIALPPDHPFWQTHFPVNDWGCGCYVLGARSRAAVRRLGGDPDKTLPDNWRDIDPKTGEPIGIGKGWGYAPGGTVSETVTSLTGKLDRLPERPAIDLIQDWLRGEGFEAWLANPVGNWPLVRISDEAAKRIGAQSRVAVISPDTLAKQLIEHPEIDIADYRAAQQSIEAAHEMVKVDDRTLVFIHDHPDGYTIVVRATRSGQGLFLSSLRRVSSEARKRSSLIRQIRKRELD